MQEQRLTARLIDYWNLIRKEEPMPDIRRLNTATIGDIWPWCCQIDVDTRSRNALYRYEYMGKPFTTLYGADLTGQTVDHRMMDFPGSVIHRKLDEVARTRDILKDSGHVLNKNGHMVKYRACFLPFGTEKDGLTHIIIGLSCRVS